MRGYVLGVSLWLTSVGSDSALSRAAQSAPEMTCQAEGSLKRVSGVPEASGLVASRSTPGRLWVHNDSGKPEIFALDANGKVTGTIAVTGAHDAETLLAAPDGRLYIVTKGDTGEVALYRVPTSPAKAAAKGSREHSRR
jgi:uncharacterized protein YjiK